MKALPLEDRPRERLLREGTDALSLAELLAIVLGSGTSGKSVLVLASEILTHFGGLDQLLEASVNELMEIKGIGLAKAVQLKAVLAIARKCRRTLSLGQNKIDSSRVAFEMVREKLGYCVQEILCVILRDVRARLIHVEQVAVGTLSEVLMHPREVFFPAVRHKAHSMIVAHNHPSGDPTPSLSDLKLTKVLIQAGGVMGIALIDHLIVCHDRYFSFLDKGHLPNTHY